MDAFNGRRSLVAGITGLILGGCMKIGARLMVVVAGLLAAQVAVAQAPAGSTGLCKDGTYTTAASKQGACRGHQGVKEWYAAAAAAAGPAAAPAQAAPPATNAAPDPPRGPAASAAGHARANA